jgi:hypothetical protein
MKFLTEQEIVQDINNNEAISEETKTVIREDCFAQVDCRMWIRNSYDLWHKDNPYTETGLDIRDGVDYTHNHPDAVSDRILKEILKR